MGAKKKAYRSLWDARQEEIDKIHKQLNTPHGDHALRLAGGFATCVGPETQTVYFVSADEVNFSSGPELVQFLRNAVDTHHIGEIQRFNRTLRP